MQVKSDFFYFILIEIETRYSIKNMNYTLKNTLNS